MEEKGRRNPGAIGGPGLWSMVVWMLGAWIAPVGSAHAAETPPVLEHLHPALVALGTTNTVSISGKFDSWPVNAWIEGQGVSIVAQTNKGKFTVQAEPGALIGPRLVRVFNAAGASEPRMLVIGGGPIEPEQEPNNAFGSPRSTTHLPTTITGRLDQNGDVDSFAVTVEAGQWLDARLEAYVLMSKVDPVLRLVTTNGLQLAWNHDTFALDPRLVWRAPARQTVVVQVFGFRYPADASIQLAGGESAVYLLHLNASTEPPRTDWGTTAEHEPNGTAATTETVALPLALAGTVESAGDEDRFRWVAAKDNFYEARVEAAALGSPLDAVLRIEDAAGKELTANDDTEGSSDPRLTWRAPQDGTNVVVVASAVKRGGPEYRYRLTLVRGEPGFRGTTTGSATLVVAGATNEWKIAVRRRNGHTNELQAVVRGLPAGMNAASVTAPAGDGEVTLKLVAAKEAAAFNGPIGIVLRDTRTEREEPVQFESVSRGENNGVPQGWSRLLVERTSALWLTVQPAAPSPP